eukprot:365691-Chlamydomonas_euryale.AAC.8
MGVGFTHITRVLQANHGARCTWERGSHTSHVCCKPTTERAASSQWVRLGVNASSPGGERGLTPGLEAGRRGTPGCEIAAGRRGRSREAARRRKTFRVHTRSSRGPQARPGGHRHSRPVPEDRHFGPAPVVKSIAAPHLDLTFEQPTTRTPNAVILRATGPCVALRICRPTQSPSTRTPHRFARPGAARRPWHAPPPHSLWSLEPRPCEELAEGGRNLILRSPGVG